MMSRLYLDEVFFRFSRLVNCFTVPHSWRAQTFPILTHILPEGDSVKCHGSPGGISTQNANML